MTITEYEPIETVGEAQAPEVYDRLPQNILTDGFSSGDHKVIGRIWILGSVLFGLFTLVADVLVRIERIDTDSVGLFSNRFAYEQWFTLQRISLVFLFVVPMLIGLAMTIVPLQIGAPSVAFPRAAAAALWTWMVAGVIMIVSWAIDGGLIDRNVDLINQPTQLSMVSLAAVVLALVVASMVIITTIFTERSQGMSLYNVPLFTWSMLVAAGIWLLSWPVLIANLIVMWIDARGDAFHTFGGDDLYGQISWAVDQPQVFAYAIPVLGLLGEVVPVALGRRLKMYDTAMVAIAVFGALSFGAYAQTFFNPAANTSWLYVIGSISLILPVLAMVAVAGATGVAAGRPPQFSSHLALAVMAVALLLAAAGVAVVRVADSLLSPILRFVNFIVDSVGDSLSNPDFVTFDPAYFTTGADGGYVTHDAGIVQLTSRGVAEFGADAMFAVDADGAIPTTVVGDNAFVADAFGALTPVDRRWDWLSDFEGWITDTFDEVAGTSLSGAMVQLAVVAGLLAALAGLWYWAPKILGRRLPSGLGLLAGLSILGGALLSAIPDAVSGFMDQPDFIASGAQRDGVEVLNLISMVGSVGVFAGFGLVLVAIAAAFFLPSDADDAAEADDTPQNDPWHGHTLEWLSASPPAPGNFAGPYVVTSEAPLLDDDFVNPYAEASS